MDNKNNQHQRDSPEVTPVNQDTYSMSQQYPMIPLELKS